LKNLQNPPEDQVVDIASEVTLVQFVSEMVPTLLGKASQDIVSGEKFLDDLLIEEVVYHSVGDLQGDLFFAGSENSTPAEEGTWLAGMEEHLNGEPVGSVSDESSPDE
jgi:hypothetical protein